MAHAQLDMRHLFVWAALPFLCLAGLSWFGNANAADAPEEARVIAHESVNTDYLTRNFLRSVFTLRVRVWPDGEPIHIFVLDDASPIHASFCRDILGTYPYVLRRTWNRTIFTGTGIIPVRVASLGEMYRRVLATPGAVGYVAGDTIKSKVPTLLIIEKLEDSL